MLLIGCDFSSAPTPRKTIVVATGALQPGSDTLSLQALHRFASLDAWGDWLAAQPAWIGGFDFPFSLPRELVERLGWPASWPELIAHYASLERAQIRAQFAAFCAARPVGGKFAHRACDGPAGSSPSMKWVNPPVAFMLHAGVPRLLAAGASFPALQLVESGQRIALEAYPGLLARELIGRISYKSDDRARQNDARHAARAELLDRVRQGRSRLRMAVEMTPAHRSALLADATGDAVDAVLCLVQAAWAARQGPPRYGIPEGIDPLEGWIVSA